LSEPALEPQEAEIVPIGQVSIYQSTDAMEQLNEARARAKVLVEVVNEQNLSKRFGSGAKPHVFVEGWQFLASQFGLIPEIEWTRELEDGWEARAALRRLSDGAIISHGDGECRKGEPNWAKAQSYAIRSMAQTRAVSKVCRIALSSVMVMAGFNATPAEEMDGIKLTQNDPHCPACLDANGELVDLWQNDKKPFWKCKAKEKCAAWDGQYAWSGWHESWENSVADFRGTPITGAAETITIDPNERTKRWDYIVPEVEATSGLVDKDDVATLVKLGLEKAVKDGRVDGEAILGGPVSEEPTADELRAIGDNLTLAEADAVVAAAVELGP
jgi:hypothetical protein